MRTVILASAAALVMSVQMAAPVKAQDTTIIKKDNDAGSTTVIKKRNEAPPFVAEPSTEKKVIIHKEHDDD